MLGSRLKPASPSAALSAASPACRLGDSGEYDYSDAETKVRLQQGLARTRTCGLCEQAFNTARLPYTVSWNAILQLRASWGVVSQEEIGRMLPSARYDEKEVCRFCGKFFDVGTDDIDLDTEATERRRVELTSPLPATPDLSATASRPFASWPPTAPPVLAGGGGAAAQHHQATDDAWGLEVQEQSSNESTSGHWFSIEQEIMEFRQKKQKLAPTRRPFRPPPVVARVDPKAALCGRMGNGSRCLRTGARCQAIVTSDYFCKGDMGTVWKLGRERALVRVDGAVRAIVLTPDMFCYADARGTGKARLRQAQSIGGNLSSKLRVLSLDQFYGDTGFAMRLVSTGPEEIFDESWDYVKAEAQSQYDEVSTAMDTSPCISSIFTPKTSMRVRVRVPSNASGESGFDLAAPPPLPPRDSLGAAAAAVAAGVVTLLCGFRAAVYAPPYGATTVVVRPDVRVAPAHSFVLCEVVAKVFRATVLERGWTEVPEPDGSEALTIFAFSPQFDELGRLMHAAVRAYPVSVIVTDCPSKPLAASAFHNPACLALCVVMYGATAIWDTVHDIQTKDINTLEGRCVDNDPWGREATVRRPLHLRLRSAAGKLEQATKYPFTALLAVSAWKWDRAGGGAVASSRGAAAGGGGGGGGGSSGSGGGAAVPELLTRFLEGVVVPEGVSWEARFVNHGLVLACTPAEAFERAPAVEEALLEIFALQNRGAAEAMHPPRVSVVPVVHRAQRPRVLLSIHVADISPLRRVVADGLAAAVAGLPIVDVVTQHVVTFTINTPTPNSHSKQFARDTCQAALKPFREAAAVVATYVSGTPPTSLFS